MEAAKNLRANNKPLSKKEAISEQEALDGRESDHHAKVIPSVRSKFLFGGGGGGGWWFGREVTLYVPFVQFYNVLLLCSGVMLSVRSVQHDWLMLYTFIQRRQSSGFSRSLLITLLVEVHVFFWKTIAFLIKLLSIVHDLNKATHTWGLQLNSSITTRRQYQQKEKIIEDISL